MVSFNELDGVSWSHTVDTKMFKQYFLGTEFEPLKAVVNDDEKIYHIVVSVKNDANIKQVCKCGSEELKKSGHARIRKYRDVPFENYRVMIYLRKQNYRCRKCMSIFGEITPSIFNKNMTVRLREYIVDCFKKHIDERVINYYANIEMRSIGRIKQDEGYHDNGYVIPTEFPFKLRAFRIHSHMDNSKIA